MVDFTQYMDDHEGRPDPAKLNVQFGVEKNPDQVAADAELARRYNLPTELVTEFKPEYETRAKVDDATKAMSDSPRLQEWLAKQPYHAEVSHDDLDNLGMVEKGFRYFMDLVARPIGGDVMGGLLKASNAGLGHVADYANKPIEMILGEDNPQNPMAMLARHFHGAAERGQAWINEYGVGNADNRSETFKTVGSGIGSVYNSLLMLPAGLSMTSGMKLAPALESFIAASPMGVQTGLAAIEDARQAGAPLWKQSIYGFDQGLIEAGTEALPLGFFLKDMKAGAPFWKVLRNQLVSENIGEQFATHLQDASTWLELHPEKTLQDYLDERPNAALQTAIATTTSTLLQTKIMHSVMRSTEKYIAQADRAEKVAQNLETMHQLSAASKVLQRDSTSFESFVNDASKDGPVSDVFIDANVLYQSGIAEQLAEVSPSIKAQLDNAVATGGDVRIPVGEYFSKIAGTEYNQGLIDHIRVDANDLSRAEARTVESEKIDELKAAVAKAIGPQTDEFMASKDRVKEAAAEILKQSGRFTEGKNSLEAELYAARTATRAAQMGITPEQLHEMQKFSIKPDVQMEGVANYNQQADSNQQGGTENALDFTDTGRVRGADGKSRFGRTIAGLPAKPDFEANTWVRRGLPGRPGQDAPFIVHRGEGRGLVADDFSLEALGYASGAAPSGRGVHFTTRMSLAEKHGTEAGGQTSSYYLDIRKPYVLHHSQTDKEYTDLHTKEDYYAYRERLRAAGHDGIVIDQTDIGGGLDIIAFDPHQVIRPNEGEFFQKRGKRDDYSLDLFGNETGIPATSGTDTPQGDTGRPAGQLQTDDAVQGEYATQTELVSEFSRTIGTDDVVTAEHAAQAMAFLSRNAVEHFDALITDKNGKPLAIVGSFKGGITQASVLPATIVAEAFRVKGAANIWFAHNHPSGKAELSSADRMLHRALAKAFQGSQIKSRGLFAIGGADGSGRSWVMEDSFGTDMYGTTTKGEATAQVPIVERVFKVEGTLGQSIEGPTVAKLVAKRISGGKPGIIFNNAQNEPVGFMPITPGENNILRTGGKMDALYRAISVANAPLSFIVSDGTMSDAELKNIAGLLNSVDSRPLDVFEPHADGYKAWSETGVPYSSSEFFQNNENRGSFAPSTNTFTILKGADLSTVLHEFGHYFFENDIALARTLASKQARTKGEQEIVDDVSAVFAQGGINGTIHEQLAQWDAMDFEEKRSHHEDIAEMFERYLMTGKAPSIELQRPFRAFKSWMKEVYKSLKEFLARNPRAGKIDDTVRGYFDRMLATEEEIKIAEQARSLMPLFDKDAHSGMSPDKFAEYHAANSAATDEAMEALDAKRLSDMQWLHNAQGREIKKLQQQAEALRRETRMQVRTEVMSMPVYRAWKFLTDKIGAESKIPAEAKTKDYSLFTAIAYLGGLKKDEVISTWGIDPKDKPNSGVFGRPLWRTEGGLSIDEMATLLGEEGFLTLDENGKVDLHEFEEKFANELGGSKELPLDHDYTERRAGDQIVNPEALNAGRIDLGELNALDVPQEVSDKLKLNKMVAQNGLHPDLIATLFDFESGDALVRELAAAQEPKAMIEQLTDQRMLQEHGEVATQEAIEIAADQAVMNTMRAKAVNVELAALAKATGDRKILTQSAHEYAAQMIARQQIKHVTPVQYSRAEARAAKAAIKAVAAGNIKEAALETRNKLINIHAAKAAYDALDEVDRSVNYLKKITSTRSLEKMRGEYKAQLLSILDRFDIRKSVSAKEIEKNALLKDWVAAEAERLAAPAPILSEQVENEAIRTHYKNLTVEEFRGLVESIKQLEHMARREHQAFLAIRKMTLQDEVENAVAEIRQAWPRAFDQEGKALVDTPLTHQYAKNRMAKASEALQHMNAEFVPMEELVDQLTAGKFGLLHESLFGRISNASDAKAIMAGEIRDRIKPAYDAYSLLEKRDFSRKVVGDSGMTRENLVMLALYYGNEEGRQRLASQGFNDVEVQQRLRHLTGKDLDLIETIWSLNDEYIWPKYEALNERTQGKAPPKVKAMPMNINGRTLQGGYVRLVYDSAFDETTRHRDSMDDAMALIGGMQRMVAKTNQGSSIERVSKLNKMPLLELRAVSQAVNEHMHDIAYREAISDTVRVLREPKMMHAIKAVSGVPVYTEMLAKLNEVAGVPRDPSGMILRGLNIARKNTIVVLMSGVKTALVNYTGLIPALFDNRISAASLVKNMAKVHSWRGAEMIRFAKENSAYMREANQQFTADLQHEMVSLTNKSQIMPEMGTFLILMRMVDQLTRTSVWLAGYEEGQRQFKDHDRAVEYANHVARSTQGSGRDVDTSKIMTRFGPWSKPFTMFYSYFNRQLALLVRQGVISRTQWESGSRAKAVGMFASAYMAIVVIPALINDIATGKCDRAMEGEDDWTRCISKAIAKNMSGYVPLARDFVPYVWGKLDDEEPDYGLRMTPVTAYYEGIGSGIKSLEDVRIGEADEKDAKSIFMGLSYATGLPGLLMWNVAAGTEATITEDAPASSILFGPPKK